MRTTIVREVPNSTNCESLLVSRMERYRFYCIPIPNVTKFCIGRGHRAEIQYFDIEVTVKMCIKFPLCIMYKTFFPI